MAARSLVGEAFVKVHADNSSMNAEVAKGMGGLSASGKNAGKDWGAKFYEGMRDEVKGKMEREFKEGFLSGDFTDFAANFKDTDEAMKVVNQRLVTMRQHGGLARDQFENLRDTARRFHDTVREASQATKDLGDERDTDPLRRSLKELLDLGGRLGRLDLAGFGKAFGKGSRNNFINLFGSMVEGAARFGTVISNTISGAINLFTDLPAALGKVTGFFRELGSAVGESFTRIGEAGGVFGKIGATFAEFGGPIIQAVAALAALAAIAGTVGIALLALGEALAVVTSALSLVLAGTIAVAGAIGVALAGALAAAAPLALALAAGFATVMIAFKNMSDKTKAQFKPLQDGFTKLGTHIADVFFKDAPKWVSGLTALMKTFAGPTMEGVATSVRNAVTGMIKDFQSPAMTAALKSIGDALGPLAGTLATAFGKAAQGVVAFLVPLLPLAQELANAIGAVASQFAFWAASAEGQSAIKTFFTTAWGLAKDLWGVVLNVGDALGTLLLTGSDQAGAGFLGWLKEKTEDLKNFLKSPEGQNQLKTWFDDAKRFGEELWTTLGKIGDTLKSLDTEQNRQFATKLIDAIGRVIAFVGTLGPAFEATGKAIEAMAIAAAPAFAILLTSISGIAHTLGLLLGAWGKLPGQEWATEASHAMEEVEKAAYEAGQEAANFPATIKTKFEGDTSKLKESIVEGQTMITTVDKDHNTLFLGSAAGLEAAASQANTGINNVPEEHLTGFEGEKFELQRVADESRGAIAGVPELWWTNFNGKDGGINRAVGDARANINTVPSVYTTAFNGDTSLLLQKIAVARQQISALTSQFAGAMGNADLGQSAGGLFGYAAGGRFMAGSVLSQGARLVIAGEDGPEAIVPLRRSLARVDPSVRGLSAYAQGLAPDRPGVTIADGAIRVIVPNANAELAAEAVLDRLVGLLG